uniref:hypothetical protein n=1 Tax=Synarthrophyton patena TaxID=48972 RepID=UPI0021824C47|nr:hypothetical protein N4M48_pgp008 [Synarthrophyton patena]UVF63013.1 hypothetical protein [Synarthrophyton patena]
MSILKINLLVWSKKMTIAFKLFINSLSLFSYSTLSCELTIEQMIIVGPESLSICIITAFFIGLVFTLQVVKEFLYLDATSLIGAILSLAFIRELSPVLTAVIIAGRIGSAFTAEIATMKVTDQIDALYLLKTDPLLYLVMPRVIACIIMLPVLNIISFFTSLASSLFACCIFYNIHPWLFLKSAFSALLYWDFFTSLLKTIVFGFIVSNISCSWGLTTVGGSKNVGQSTTSSVVTSLLMIFMMDFVLSSLMFYQSSSAIKSL